MAGAGAEAGRAQLASLRAAALTPPVRRVRNAMACERTQRRGAWLQDEDQWEGTW